MILLYENSINDIDSLNQIAKKTLGEGYVTAESILENPISIHARISRIQEFLDGNVNDPICTGIVGYGTACVDYPHVLGTEYKTLAEIYSEKTGIICNVCTDPDYQRQGIGTRIVEEIIDRLKKMGQTKVVASAWRSVTGINIGPIFDKLGFKQITEISGFYSGCACIQCDPELKGIDCVCPAVIYELTI